MFLPLSLKIGDAACTVAHSSGNCQWVSLSPYLLVVPMVILVFAWLAWRTKDGDFLGPPSLCRRLYDRVVARAWRLFVRPPRDGRPSEFIWQLVAMQQSGAEETQQWGVCRVQLLVWLLCVQRLQAMRWRRSRGTSTSSLSSAGRSEIAEPTAPVLPQMAKSRIEAFIGPGWQCGAVTAPYARAIARAAHLCSQADALSAQARAARQVDAAVTAITKDIIDPQVLDAARKGRHRCECIIDTTSLSPEAVSAVTKANAAVLVLGKRSMAQVIREHLTSCGYRVSLAEIPLDTGLISCNCGQAVPSSASSRSARLLGRLECSRRRVSQCRTGTCRPYALCLKGQSSWTTWLEHRLAIPHWLGYLLGHHDRIVLERLKVSLYW